MSSGSHLLLLSVSYTSEKTAMLSHESFAPLPIYTAKSDIQMALHLVQRRTKLWESFPTMAMPSAPGRPPP
jgi:hypothetical protein